jgi:colicin import membrane protein
LQAAATEQAALAATVAQMRRQIEAQQAELERVHTEAEAERRERQREVERLAAELERERTEAAAARKQAAEESNRQRRETERQGAELARLAAALETERQAAQSLTLRVSQAEADRDAGRLEASAMREEAARWRGQAEAWQAQHAALLASFHPRPDSGEAESGARP